jgi:hypothetical protein
LKKLHALPWEWSDVEALERQHNIGCGSLILLDYLPQDHLPGRGLEETYTKRKRFINLSAARVGGTEVHKELHRPIANDRVYLPMTWRMPQGAQTSSLQLWNFLKNVMPCSAANPARNSGKVWSRSVTTVSIPGNGATPNWIFLSG